MIEDAEEAKVSPYENLWSYLIVRRDQNGSGRLVADVA
jgi:hypothetical protein